MSDQKRARAKRSVCKARAAHRAAQKKYVKKNVKAQRDRVKKSQAKHGKKKTAGLGKHGHQIGRPQKECSQ